MSKLRSLELPVIDRLNGYLAAAQYAFIKANARFLLATSVIKFRRTTSACS